VLRLAVATNGINFVRILVGEARTSPAVLSGGQMEVCYHCKVPKDLSEFGTRIGVKSGHQSWCKVCSKECAREHYRKLKIECFEHYGGVICVCCKETEICFLSLDHENNDGSERRRLDSGRQKGKGGNFFYRWLKKNGYPDMGLRVLCHNCNHGRFINGGICPHQDLSRKG
jgi:hypothetical protein